MGLIATYKELKRKLTESQISRKYPNGSIKSQKGKIEK